MKVRFAKKKKKSKCIARRKDHLYRSLSAPHPSWDTSCGLHNVSRLTCPGGKSSSGLSFNDTRGFFSCPLRDIWGDREYLDASGFSILVALYWPNFHSSPGQNTWSVIRTHLTKPFTLPSCPSITPAHRASVSNRSHRLPEAWLPLSQWSPSSWSALLRWSTSLSIPSAASLTGSSQQKASSP